LIFPEETDELKKAVVKLYEDNDFRHLLGKNARHAVMEKYTWEINARKIESICRGMQK
jgi:glycosyltransferase involved in cell wall biosynthesis